MGIVSVVKALMPAGRAWEDTPTLDLLNKGSCIELDRVHNNISFFHKHLNIVQSELFAERHAREYLINKTLFTNVEIQRIITEYLNKDYDVITAIADFAEFINADIKLIKVSPCNYIVDFNLLKYFTFGVSSFGFAFGDVNEQVQNNYTQFAKIKWLVNYLKPPYVNIRFENIPERGMGYFRLGASRFNDAMGENL